MDNSNIQKTNSPFFEGWYFKHMSNNSTIAFIVGRNVETNGAGSAFIQVITENTSYNINYPLDTFRNFKKKFIIKVGESYFTEKGIFVNIDTENLKIKGKIHYSKLLPLKYPIMGPFKAIPKMECQHEVLSMQHKLFGKLNFNSQIIDFNNGTGYIESDAGHSFPKKYSWLQCNSFENIKASVMVAVAEIPFFKKSFLGTICVLNYKGKEYRLATYLGGKVEFCNDYCIIVKQRKYKIVIKLFEAEGQRLFAPNHGNMSRVITQNISAPVKIWFYKDDELMFFGQSKSCTYEIAK